MNLPVEILYKIAEQSDDRMKTLKELNLEPRTEDWKYVYKNKILAELKIKMESCTYIETDVKIFKVRSQRNDRVKFLTELVRDQMRGDIWWAR